MQLKRHFSAIFWCFGALLVSVIEAQNPVIVANPPSETAFSNLRVEFSYPGTFQFVPRVDFRNLPVHLFDSSGEVGTLSLRNGAYQRNDQPFGFEELRVESVQSLTDLSGSGRQYTLVIYKHYFGGGSSNTDGLAQVFVLSQRRLVVTQQLEWDEHYAPPDGWYVRFSDGLLTIRSARYLELDTHCCISGMDVITLRWDGSQFSQVRLVTQHLLEH